ncbi:hypothetical protein LTR99_000525 [Exophiala xenobiotica]|uniref:Uncharacterized protein n=1 Tax=Vermiconidia calcicola TaxID=1690605 RepID=A0AAV9QH07_9PEZI|nr:hypothetical protein LTR99_000525 [Exophiala xenobiotica]KAK5439556.1 hypothetical protein LTR34_000524 [Exophiala xenobiotica]KAK5543649.1 hypothetical protein LTR25_001263 [Vermiconidia calcicola]KAK5548326.1 hypothetical protein LTR23_001455 [Chaetothyriales sp. CCFEE 6169]
MSPQSRPRKFLPQPVEESVRSSRKKTVEHVEDNEPKGTSTKSSSPHHSYSHYDDPTLPGIPNSRPLTTPRRFTPEPVESSTRSPRRKFAPEPIETSTRSSKDKEEPQEEAASRPRRKFATEPVETSTRSSKSKESDAADENQTPRPRRKFAPEPIETTKTTRRRRDTVDSDDADSEPLPSGDSLASSRASSGPRKWQPELLETAKGSYRRVYPSKETALRRPPPSPSLSEEETVDEGASVGESRFSAAALARKQSGQSRQHSFQVPDLPMIESTTEESESPSLSDCTSSIDTDTRKDDDQSSEKDNYTEYVLRLARETVTEAELQEAAMAAYINERPHEPVDHFAFAQDDDEDGPLPVPMFQSESGADARTFRRSSADELDLELEGMRKHHEHLERTKKDVEAETAGPSRFSAAAVAARQAKEAKVPQKSKKPRPLDEDSEFSRMRAAASPPMLGDDLVFPFTISPKMTRCDPDQPPRPRNAESDDDESRDVGSPHLWISDTKIKNDGSEGLWMGMCQAGMWQPRSQRDGLRSGIQTPAPGTPATERFNPFEVAMPVRGSLTPGRGAQTPGRRRPVSGISFLPLTPPRSQDGDEFTNTIDKKLQLEKQIEEEFPPRVITQIYNYLSLGYPSLAHMFDEELSKISRIPLEELRKDDYQADAKGYVGAPEGDGCNESQLIGGRCKRWEALKVYVHEWARQSPNFVDERPAAALGADEDWGARARKGSWGQ